MKKEYIYEDRVWLFPYERVLPNEHVNIYGAGFIGSRLIQQVLMTHYCSIEVVADKRWDEIKQIKWGGVLVRPPKELLGNDYKIIVAIGDETISNSIVEYLVKIGVDEGRIIYDLRSIPFVGQREKMSPVSVISHINKGEMECLYSKNRINELLGLLLICKSNVELTRIGNEYDGGYVMANRFAKKGIAYSFGISDDYTWDIEMSKRGYDVFMYDHTIDGVYVNDEKLHFSRVGIADSLTHSGDVDSLENILRANGHESVMNMIMKMDVEGAEYGFMDSVSVETLKQFDQIVFEMHDLHSRIQDVIRFLRKIERVMTLVHVHVNNFADAIDCEDYLLPDAIEVTFLNTDLYSFKEKWTNNEYISADSPNWKDIPDLYFV